MRRDNKHGGAIWRRVTNDKTGKTAEIRLSKTGWFSCRVGDSDREYLVAKTADDVIAFANKFVDTPDEAVAWTPVMNVEVEQDRYSYRRRRAIGDLDINIKLDAKRYWVTQTALGVWRVVWDWTQLDAQSPGKLSDADALGASEPWGTANEIETPSRSYSGAPKRGRPFKLPHQNGEGDVVMAYDPALWAGVTRLVHAIEGEFEMITQLLSTAEGHTQLRAIGDGSAQFAITAESESTKAAKAKGPKPKRKRGS